jgi:tRNA ligase
LLVEVLISVPYSLFLHNLPSMNDRNTAPFLAQDLKEIEHLIKVMNEHAGKGKKGSGFGCRKKTYEVNNAEGRTVDSWAMQDWDYKKPNLPTYSRGLFTTTCNGKPEIAVRGYDKFFNVGEVRKTEWPNVEKNTRGPYELSVKENGCIIFVAGLTDDTLVITSKHSTGSRAGNDANHALAGEQWIDKQLKSIGKTRADLAKRLRSMNATAVAELCDDEFEEHVLEYSPENAGLYLHGINLNLPEFATYPGNKVHDFAEEWGFRKVMFIVKETIADVKPFLEHIAETGHYDGRDTEGFVIRCQARETEDAQWEDWFFKYKFEEPYLMYRQWRECTKAVIAGREPKIKKHKKITEEYLLHARRQFAKTPQLSKEYTQNHGIIALRNSFLAEKGMKGSDIIKGELEEGGSNELDVTKNVVLLPVATIGCGKTTLALAMVKLFGWGHEQNDNITGPKSRPPRFALATTNSLMLNPVTIADRNNHQRRERKQIIEDVKKVNPDVKFVALHYVHDRSNYDAIRKSTQDRVFSRGDNHQTIQAGSKGKSEIQGIMEGFMGRFEPVNADNPPDDEFDLVIDLDPTVDTRANLHTTLEKLHHEYPSLFQMPTNEEMDVAVETALGDYKPDIKHDLSKKGGKENSNKKRSPDEGVALGGNGKKQNGTPPKPKTKSVEYFCIQLPVERVNSILTAVFGSEDATTSRFYHQLREGQRVQKDFHVTLMHRASSSQNKDYWNKLNDQWKNAVGNKDVQAGTDGGVTMGEVRVHLERVIWDDRVMAILARLPDAEDQSKGAFKSINEHAHITIGTANDDIKPKESNDLLARWLQGMEGEIIKDVIKDVRIKGQVVLNGKVAGVLSR